MASLAAGRHLRLAVWGNRTWFRSAHAEGLSVIVNAPLCSRSLFRRPSVGYQLPHAVVEEERTTEQKIASGRTEWTPFAVLGSVFGVVALLVVVVVALAALAYFLA